jgi:hypothetical protein
MHKLIPSADITESRVICGALTTWPHKTQEVPAVTCMDCLRLLSEASEDSPLRLGMGEIPSE